LYYITLLQLRNTIISGNQFTPLDNFVSNGASQRKPR